MLCRILEWIHIFFSLFFLSRCSAGCKHLTTGMPWIVLKRKDFDSFYRNNFSAGEAEQFWRGWGSSIRHRKHSYNCDINAMQCPKFKGSWAHMFCDNLKIELSTNVQRKALHIWIEWAYFYSSWAYHSSHCNFRSIQGFEIVLLNFLSNAAAFMTILNAKNGHKHQFWTVHPFIMLPVGTVVWWDISDLRPICLKGPDVFDWHWQDLQMESRHFSNHQKGQFRNVLEHSVIQMSVRATHLAKLKNF